MITKHFEKIFIEQRCFYCNKKLERLLPGIVKVEDNPSFMDKLDCPKCKVKFCLAFIVPGKKKPIEYVIKEVWNIDEFKETR